MSKIIKVVIIGPESTGKSTLCKQLAQHFDTLWCPEYARNFLAKNGTGYTYSQLLTIAQGQLAQEDVFVAKMNTKHNTEPRPLFIDTDMQVMRVWCEFVFGKCHAYILQQIQQRKYNLYLLCYTDLPWVRDEMREYPDENIRRQLFTIYHNTLSRQSISFITISGNYDQRLKQAIHAVEKLL